MSVKIIVAKKEPVAFRLKKERIENMKLIKALNKSDLISKSFSFDIYILKLPIINYMLLPKFLLN